MKYKVVPFVGHLDQKRKLSSDYVAQQLELAIRDYTSQGWGFS